MPQELFLANPLDLVEQQLAAYNERNLDRFLEVFSEDIEVVRLPGTTPVLSGKAAFGRFYADSRFNLPGLRAEIVARLVAGNTVIDHETIHGIGDAPQEIVVIYGIEDNLIRRMWSMLPGGQP
jgi:hypothetical protein